MPREHLHLAGRIARRSVAALGLLGVAALSSCTAQQADTVGQLLVIPFMAFIIAAPFIFGFGRGGCH